VTGWGGDAAALTMLRIAMAVNAEPASWLDLAACTEVDPAIFFPERGEPAAPAKRVCMTCLVRAQCLDYALEHRINHGVWGGLGERQRRALLKQNGGRAA
jgi:WhiB family transcriptional regulator, redox-sensing transcriptional regulator